MLMPRLQYIGRQKHAKLKEKIFQAVKCNKKGPWWQFHLEIADWDILKLVYCLPNEAMYVKPQILYNQSYQLV